ncbi:MAG: hypothetical protein KGK14_08910, partial [Bacteroidota bacterium]|nr:hypothetical protein [Bacteroidota bacterium]
MAVYYGWQVKFCTVYNLCLFKICYFYYPYFTLIINKNDYTPSYIIAAPCPTPTHIVANPY